MKIDISLLRERFLIEETTDQVGCTGFCIRACSNRISINLQSENLAQENFVIRTDSMHLCTRMSAQILTDYERHGPFTPRLDKMQWNILRDNSLSDYDKRYNDNKWLAIYHKGKLIHFEGKKHHKFLDIIEQFEWANSGDYTGSLDLAEEAFKKAGKNVKIDYCSNIALVALIDKTQGRCSMILRSPDQTRTFNYLIKPMNDKDRIILSQILTSAGDFLEGVNLSYIAGVITNKMERGIIEKYSDEWRQGNNARKRIASINAQINSLENRYKVRYRPERPLFDLIITQAEEYAQKHIAYEGEFEEEEEEENDDDEKEKEEDNKT